MAELERNAYFLDEVLFEKNMEENIQTEISLPDYCPDISTCLQCFAFVNVVSGSYDDTKIKVEGNILLRLLYLSDGEIFSFEKSEPFTAQTEHNCASLGAVLEMKSVLEYVNCRAINQRKFEIKGSFVIQATLSQCSDISVRNMSEMENVELNKETLIACSAGGKSGEVVNLSQVLDIGTNKPEIKSIIRTIAVPMIEQTKQVSGKVLVKGELKLKTLYKSFNSTIENIENSIPLSRIIELSGVDEDSTLDIKLSLLSLEVEVKPNALGNMSLLDIRAGVGMIAACYNCVDFPVIDDAFSTSCESSCSYENVCVDRIVDKIDKNYMHKVSVANSADIQKVLDIWCDQIQCNAQIQDDKLVFSGNFELYILYENSAGQLSLKNSHEKFGFEEAVEKMEMLKCNPSARIIGSDYVLNADSLTVRVDIEISAVVLDRMCKKIVSDIALSEESCLIASGLHIIYAHKGESLWNLAKQFKTSVENIKAQNNLESDPLIEDKKLLIWS